MTDKEDKNAEKSDDTSKSKEDEELSALLDSKCLNKFKILVLFSVNRFTSLITENK